MGLQFWDWYGDGSAFVVDLGLACCTLEFEAAATGRRPADVADPAELPRDAHVVVVVSGTVTDRLTEPVLAVIDRVRRGAPQATVVAFGACASAGGPYWDSYSVTKGIDQFTVVDRYVPGCPPPPDALHQVLAELTGRVPEPASQLPETAEPRGPGIPEPVGPATPRIAEPVAVPPDELREMSAADWRAAVRLAREQGYDWFDWLGAVDRIGRADTIAVIIRLVAVPTGAAVRLTTAVPRDRARLDSVADIFPGAGWHERESAELFGVAFSGADRGRLLLPDDYVGTPLRKDTVLAARAAVEWPGVKEPGGAPSRRRMVPPGVPEPEIWGDRDPDQPAAAPAEIAESAVGGRVRRRRR